jgi:hypothetical protein
MRPKKHEATEEGDLFRARLDQIINIKHELVQLGGKIDWAWNISFQRSPCGTVSVSRYSRELMSS